MFQHLKQFSKILVSGPQRSGTRICANMVAEDTGLTYVDEVELKCLFIIGSELQCVTEFVQQRDNFVLHCPTFSRWVHEISDDVAIVFMRRDMKDIQRSQERIRWKRNRQEIEYQRYGLTKFDSYRNKVPQRHPGGLRKTSKSVAEVKYNYWDGVQKDQIENVFEINYLDLRAHPMWVDRFQRTDFRWNQVRTADSQEP